MLQLSRGDLDGGVPGHDGRFFFYFLYLVLGFASLSSVAVNWDLVVVVVV